MAGSAGAGWTVSPRAVLPRSHIVARAPLSAKTAAAARSAPGSPKRSPAAPSDDTQAAPFVKWAGGKRQIMDKLIAHVPVSFGRYYEPFVGGAALYYELVARGWVRSTAILGDNNALLMNAYTQIKVNVEAVIRELKQLRYDETLYYEIRAAFPSGLPAVCAAHLIYLNKTCFNGLWRVNKSGKYNAPFGRYTNPTICDEVGLRRVSKALKQASMMTGDFERLVAQAVAGDFVYFDPPYWPRSATSDFTAYSKDPFGPLEQERLRDVALALKKRGVKVLLSNADVEPVRQLYARGFKIERVEAKRHINSKASRRGKVGELLVT